MKSKTVDKYTLLSRKPQSDALEKISIIKSDHYSCLVQTWTDLKYPVNLFGLEILYWTGFVHVLAPL